MNILITVSHKAELDPLLNRFDNSQSHKMGQIEVYRCSVGKVKVTILQTGMGVKNAAKSLKKFLEIEDDHSLPEVIFNIGSAGALKPERKIGELVIGSISLREIRSEQKRNLRSRWTRSLEKYLLNQEIEYVNGRILSVKQPIKSSEKKAEIFEETGADVVEMECDGLAEISQRWEIPLLPVKCISDLAGEEVSNEYVLHLPKVTKRLTNLMYGFVASLTETDH